MTGSRCSSDDGAILILAMTYLVAVGLVVALLSTWATNDLNNSSKFSSANSLTLAATDMTDTAIQYVRYDPMISTSQPVFPYVNSAVACWGGTSTQAIPVINGVQIAVWCTTAWSPLSLKTRDVIFYACPIAVSAASCASTTQPNALLTVEVYYDDYPTANAPPILDLCTTWCGSGMTIESWKWGASTSGDAASAATKITFSNEPSDTSVGVATDASVTVTDANGKPVEGDTVTIDPVVGISTTLSTLAAVTNANGVAEFSNIYPDTVEQSVVLTARDGSLTTTSSSFAISIQKSVIQVLSSAPANATQGGATYAVSASASSGDNVGIGSSTPTVCVVSGVKTTVGITSGTVSFTKLGTCTLTFTDSPSANPNYGAAVPVTQSFSVGGLTATQVAIVLSTTTPAASSTTNVTITMTLENAVGVPVNSVGTTTVVLSDIGSGAFATSNGVTGNSSLGVSFANGKSTAVAYFGDATTGSDTISAFNGTTNWGSATLTVNVGSASQVLITPATTSPAVSSSTNTALTFQLEDQLGNPVASSGTTTLVLSDTGSGFFAPSNGSAGTSTLNVTFADGAGTATAYFGNKTSGAVILTAKNGANVWGTTTLTPVAGVATSVQVTLSPTNLTRSTRTNATVTLQLMDQYGNPVLESGVIFTLSNSGSGFFATANGARGTATLSVTTNAAGVAKAYFGDDTNESITITAASPGVSVTTPPFTD
jgi:hypothetical protein